MRDFSYEKYSRLCQELMNNDYKTLTVREFLSSRPDKGYAILRHDVDTKPHRALRLALLEQSIGISSTYYFRHTQEVFNPQIIKEVADLGHEVGYHYEVLSKKKGDYPQAIALFKEELADFRKITEISTICMHGSPLSAFDNRDLWKTYNFSDFRILGEAYLSMDKGMFYCSDTGWRWDNKYKVRDYLPGNKELNARTTDEIITAIRAQRVPSLYLLVHPGNWASGGVEWILTWGENLIGNAIKSVVLRMRSRGFL